MIVAKLSDRMTNLVDDLTKNFPTWRIAIFVRFSIEKVYDLMIEQDFIDEEIHKPLHEFHGILPFQFSIR